MTREKVEALQEEADAAAAEVARLNEADIRTMWLSDLDEFLAAYDAWEEEEAASQAQLARQQKQQQKGRGKKAAAAVKSKGKKADPWSDEEASEEEEEDWMEDDNDFVVRGAAELANWCRG